LSAGRRLRLRCRVRTGQFRHRGEVRLIDDWPASRATPGRAAPASVATVLSTLAGPLRLDHGLQCAISSPAGQDPPALVSWSRK